MIEAPVKASSNGEYGFPIPEDPAALRITIDGDSRCYVMAYDTEEGWVESYLLTDDGEYVMQDERFIIKREHGAVKASIASSDKNHDQHQ